MASVHVVIDDAHGNIFEQGEAVRAEGFWWIDTTSSQVRQDAEPCPAYNRHRQEPARQQPRNGMSE